MNISLYDNTVGFVRKERENSFPNKSECSVSVSAFPSNTPIAMAYVPFQSWGETLSPDDALNNGTLFKELVLPFVGCPARSRFGEKGGARC